MNNCIFIGRLTADPEVNLAGNGEESVRIARFTLAVERERQRKRNRGSNDNDPDSNADFPRFVAFDRMAELAETYLYRGALVAVQTEYNTGSYTGRDGKKRYTEEFRVYKMKFLDKKSEGTAAASGASSPVMGAGAANELMSRYEDNPGAPGIYR